MRAALRFMLLLAAAVAVVAISACGSSTTSSTRSGGRAELQGLILRPPKSAPGLALRNYTGQPVKLSRFRGRAVLVSFVYTHCPDVCPLIVAGLAAAQRQLGPGASRVQILAVTVDPRRDTPRAIRAFLSARDAVGRMYYLIGSPRQLLPIWKAWDIGVAVDTHKVLAGHTSLVYGITGSGRVAVVYPANFTPAEIVHDVPLLARS